MRNTAFLAIGIGLLIIQSNLFRLVGRLQISGATPSLLLPLVVFMGVHEYSMARGAALAFLLGYLLDLFSAAPIGLLRSSLSQRLSWHVLLVSVLQRKRF